MSKMQSSKNNILYQREVKSLFVYLFKNITKPIKKKRKCAAEYNLDLSYLLDLYKSNDGKCAISGQILTTKGSWMVSVDRIDNSFGEIKGNVRLICHEFQCPDRTIYIKNLTNEEKTFTNWCEEKFETARLLMCQPVTEKEIKEIALEVEKSKIPSKHCTKKYKNRIFEPKVAETERDPNMILLAECMSCRQLKFSNDFNKRSDTWHGLKSHCRICSSIGSKNLKNLLRGRLLSLLNSAKSSTERKRYSSMTLTFDEISTMYQNCAGRCMYSNIKLSLKSHSNWMISLERLNTKLGYSKENCALISNEFNISHTQWSRAKVEKVWNVKFTPDNV